MTTQTVAERSHAVAERLRKEARFESQPYAKGPLGRDIFSMSINSGLHRIWTGSPEVEIYADKTHHQAVLEVREQQHVVERPVRVWNAGAVHRVALRRARARRTFPVSLPAGTKFSFPHEEFSEAADRWTITVRATVPATHQFFLTGMDETAPFVALLPDAVRSVDAAHAMLRPPRLPKGTLRQGEFFFSPVTATERKAIEAYLKHNPLRQAGIDAWTGRDRRGHVGARLESGSTHVATLRIKVGGHFYAFGTIIDLRQGHHQPLFLPDWHRVTRNREVVQRAQQTANGRRRARYYD